MLAELLTGANGSGGISAADGGTLVAVATIIVIVIWRTYKIVAAIYQKQIDFFKDERTRLIKDHKDELDRLTGKQPGDKKSG